MPANPAWNDWEDQRLRELVEEHGPKRWSLIASRLKTKGSKQCRRRWKNFLNADLKQGEWSAEEDRILMEGHRRFGNKWTEIARLVGGRTDNAVKNRWAALCKRTKSAGTRTGAGGRADAGGRVRRGSRPSSHVDDDDDESESNSDDEPPTPPVARSPSRAHHAGSLTTRQQAAAAATTAAQHAQAASTQAHHQEQQQQPPTSKGLFASSLYPPAVAAAAAFANAAAMAVGVVKGTANFVLGKRSTPGTSPQEPQAKRLHLDSLVQHQLSEAPLPLNLNVPRPAHLKQQAPQATPLAAVTFPCAPQPQGGQGKKARPELTLLIPNNADPPAARHPVGLQIHVSKELLSLAEVRYAQELNSMEGTPLHISLEDPLLEPPLSTSRRAAQDALSALVADSPAAGAAGLGPLTLGNLGHGLGAGAGGHAEFGLPIGPGATGAPTHAGGGGSEVDEVVRWLQHVRTPRGGTVAGAGPAVQLLAGPAGAHGSPRLSQTSARLQQTQGAADKQQQHGQAMTQNAAAAGAAGGPQPQQQGGALEAKPGQPVMQLHEGHLQLVSKLLLQARVGGGLPLEGAATATGQAGAPTPGAHSSPWLQAGHSHRPWGADAATTAGSASGGTAGVGPSCGNRDGFATGTQAAVAVSALPLPTSAPLSIMGRRTRHSTAQTGAPLGVGEGGGAGSLGAAQQQGQRAHPGLLANLVLPSPVLGGAGGDGGGPGMGGGPLSSGRSAGPGAWAGLEVLLTPAISNQEIDSLLDLLVSPFLGESQQC